MTLRVCGLLSVLLFAAAIGSARAETLEMKDGSKVVGTVVEETDSAITLKVKFGTIIYQKSEIKNIDKEGVVPAPPAKVAAKKEPPAPAAPATPPTPAVPPKEKVESKPKTEVAAPAKPKPEEAPPAAPKPKESDPFASTPKPKPQPQPRSNPDPSTEVSSAPRSSGEGELRDVVVLKAGGEQRGFLVSESDTEVVFDVVMSGKSVAKTMLSRTTFHRGEVDSIKKLTDEQRAAALKDLNNAAKEEKRDKAAAQNIEIEPYSWQLKNDPSKSVQVKRVQLTHFSIESDIEDDDLLRKLAYRLDKVFNAYQQYFGVDRNDAVKVRVMIFKSMEEFYASNGTGMLNPAFYSPLDRQVLAGCDVKKYEMQIAEIRERHKKLEIELHDWKIRVEEARADVRAQVSKAYDQVNAGGKGATAAGQAAMENIKQQEREWMLDVGAKEKHVNEIQDLIFQCNRHNDVVFGEVTQQMLSTMYHEGFHAFLHNFLFESEEALTVPRWLNEGLAQYFEAARLENGHFILGQDVREKMAILRKFRNAESLLPLEKLVSGGAADYQVHEIANLERSTKNYLQAWLLTSVLGDKGRLKKEILQAYVTAMKNKPALEALPVLTGIPNDQLEQAMEDKLKPGFQASPEPEKK